jgi:hypothetical protein
LWHGEYCPKCDANMKAQEKYEKEKQLWETRMEEEEQRRREVRRQEENRKESKRMEAERESLRKEGEGRKEVELREVNIKLVETLTDAENARKEKVKAVTDSRMKRKGRRQSSERSTSN